jgi:hypothetical protein
MQSLANMYVEEVKGEGRTDAVCYSGPGLSLFSTIANGGQPRGQITASEVHYVVMGTRFYSVTSGGVETDLGEIEGTALVDMSFNGNQIDIVAELKSYSYDVPTLTLSEISDPNFTKASSCDSLNSYSIFAVAGTGQFQWRLTNSATFNALDFATAEAESDNLVAVRKVGNELALLGNSSVEWWYTTGESAPGDAFAKTSTAAASIGCVSRDAALVFDSGLTWVGRDGKAGGMGVYRAEGYTPRKISPPQVDTYLEQVTSPSSLRAFSYQQRGHLFYVLTNPGEWTLAWDIATGIWSYRKSGSWSQGADPLGGWDAVTFGLNGSKQIVGRSDGNLYAIEADTLTEAGNYITREVTTPQFHQDGRRIFEFRLELDIEAGVGITSGQGSAPLVYESHSDDGGKTWSQPRAASMGAIGQNKFRAVWYANGSYRQRIRRFRCSDPVTVVFLSAWADIRVGSL